MEEIVKSRVILILGILTLIFFITTVSSCGSTYRNRLAYDKEMVKRMDLEEKLSKITQEKTKLSDQFNAAQKELQEEKANHQVSKKALVQEQLVNQSLKEDLTKVTKLKEALEEDLKEALIQQGSTVTK
jgi:chromosome segregation ATPase